MDNKTYDPIAGQEYIQTLLRKHNIKVRNWLDNNSKERGYSGLAFFDGKTLLPLMEVDIPVPDDFINFCICLHEIGHCLDPEINKVETFISEYTADNFAITTARNLGYDASYYAHKMKPVLRKHIANALNKRYPVDDIPPYIAEFVMLPVELLKKYLPQGYKVEFSLDYDINIILSKMGKFADHNDQDSEYEFWPEDHSLQCIKFIKKSPKLLELSFKVLENGRIVKRTPKDDKINKQVEAISAYVKSLRLSTTE